jgi:hypothetical protein
MRSIVIFLSDKREVERGGGGGHFFGKNKYIESFGWKSLRIEKVLKQYRGRYYRN